jgi:protein SCO1/2
MLSGMLRVLIIGLVLLVAIIWMLPRNLANVQTAVATVLPEPQALPEFALTDHNGAAFGNADLEGKFTLLFFGFTNCPDICPLTLKTLADARAEMLKRGADHAPQIVFVSVDPERDSAERIARYLGNFEAELRGATGPEHALAPLVAKLGVTVEKHVHAGESYNVVHNSTIYVVGPDAKWLAISSAPHDPVTLADDYAKIRRRYAAAHPSPTA